MTRVLAVLFALCLALPAWAQDPPPFSSKSALLNGRSGGQILHGGTQPGDSLTLAPTSSGTPDRSTGVFAGAQLNMGESGENVMTWFSRGAKSISGPYIPIAVTDGGTWTIGAAATCANVGGEDASWCIAADVPHGCCTGEGTGNCGYCDGSAGSQACEVDGDCASGAAYLSQWWHTIDYAATPGVIESFVTQVFGPMITASGGGTRTLGHQAFADYAPIYYMTSGRNTDITLSSLDGLFFVPTFRRPSGTNTGTVARISGLALDANVADAGWTVDDIAAVTLYDPAKHASSTITDIGAVDVAQDITTGATGGQTYALRSAIAAAAHKYFLLNTGGAQNILNGKTRIGDTTNPTAQLETIGPSTLTNVSTLNVSGSLTAGVSLLNIGNAGISVGSSGSLTAVNGSGTVTLTANPGIFGLGNFFQHGPTIRNTDGAGSDDATNVTITGIGSYAASPVILADDNTGALTLNNNILGLPAYAGLTAAPTFSIEEGATATAQTVAGVVVTTPNSSIASGWTIDDWYGLWMKDPGGSGTVTDLVGVRCEALAEGATLNACMQSVIANASNKYFLAHTGGADSVMSGALSIGPTALAAPPAQLHVQEQTVTNEVVRIESVATNDDPNYKVFQYRTTSSGNATVTLATHDLVADKVALVEARIVGVCTANCATVGTGGAGVVFGRFRDIGGTATEIGAEVVDIALSEDTDGSWAAPAMSASAGNVLVQVTTSGDADIAITWHTTLIVQDVGS